MFFFHFILFLIFFLFIIGCDEGDKIDVELSSNTPSSIEIDLGELQRVKVYESINIVAKDIPNSQDVATYLWREENRILATTRSFLYTPTQTGLNTLELTVRYNNGVEVKDTLILFVTMRELNSTIPLLSNSLKSEYLTAINSARSNPQDCGSEGLFSATSMLSWSDKLYKAAYEHTQDLISSKTFAHEGSGTQSDWTGYALGRPSDLISRSEAYGYLWRELGENLAAGTTRDTAQKAVASWLESDKHCANLMNPNFTEVGMAMIKDENSLYIHYWTQNFGTPK